MAVVLIVARSKYMRKNNKYMRIYLFRTESRYNMKLQAAVPGLKTVFNDKKTYPAVCLVVSRCPLSLSFRNVRTIVVTVVRSACRQFTIIISEKAYVTSHLSNQWWWCGIINSSSISSRAVERQEKAKGRKRQRWKVHERSSKFMVMVWVSEKRTSCDSEFQTNSGFQVICHVTATISHNKSQIWGWSDLNGEW